MLWVCLLLQCELFLKLETLVQHVLANNFWHKTNVMTIDISVLVFKGFLSKFETQNGIYINSSVCMHACIAFA